MTTATIDLDLPPEHLLRQIHDALAARPDVREPLLRVLLTEGFLELPAKVSRLQESHDEFREETRDQFRIAREETQEQFRAAREETQQQFRAVNERMDQHARALRRLEGHVGRMRGNSYEDVCRYEINAVMDGPFVDPVLADRDLIRDRLRQARRSDLISRDEYLDALRTDIIIREDADETHTQRLGIIEASLTFNRGDLETAARRAAIIRRVLAVPADPFVITQNEWPGEVDDTARQLGVTVIRNQSPQFEPDYDW